MRYQDTVADWASEDESTTRVLVHERSRPLISVMTPWRLCEKGLLDIDYSFIVPLLYINLE